MLRDLFYVFLRERERESIFLYIIYLNNVYIGEYFFVIFRGDCSFNF